VFLKSDRHHSFGVLIYCDFETHLRFHFHARMYTLAKRELDPTIHLTRGWNLVTWCPSLLQSPLLADQPPFSPVRPDEQLVSYVYRRAGPIDSEYVNSSDLSRIDLSDVTDDELKNMAFYSPGTTRRYYFPQLFLKISRRNTGTGDMLYFYRLNEMFLGNVYISKLYLSLVPEMFVTVCPPDSGCALE